MGNTASRLAPLAGPRDFADLFHESLAAGSFQQNVHNSVVARVFLESIRPRSWHHFAK